MEYFERDELQIEWLKTALADRVDIAIKFTYAYLRFQLGFKAFDDLYLDHIRCMTGSTFSEDDKKNGNDFIGSYERLYQSMRTFGFNREISEPLVNLDGKLINGAHRVSLSLLLGLKPSFNTVPDVTPIEYNKKFFEDRGYPLNYLNFAVDVFQAWHYRVCIKWKPPKFPEFDPYGSYRHEYLSAREYLVPLLAASYLIGTTSPTLSYSGIASKLLAVSRAEGGEIALFNLPVDSKISKETYRDTQGGGYEWIHQTDEFFDTFCLLSTLRSVSELVADCDPRFTLDLSIGCLKKLVELQGNDQVSNFYYVYGSLPLQIYSIRRSRDVDYKILDREEFMQNIMIRDVTSLVVGRAIIWSLTHCIEAKIRRGELKDSADLAYFKAIVRNRLLDRLTGVFLNYLINVNLLTRTILIRTLERFGIKNQTKMLIRKLLRRG